MIHKFNHYSINKNIKALFNKVVQKIEHHFGKQSASKIEDINRDIDIECSKQFK